jgi:membrane protein
MDTLGALRRIGPWKLAPWLAVAAMGAATAYAYKRRPPAASLSDERTMSPEHFEASEPGRGRSAGRLRDIPPKGWRDILWRTLLEIPRDRLAIVAGGVTFFSLLALAPMLNAFVTVYGMLADVTAVESQVDQLSLFFPSTVVEIIRGQMVRLAEADRATLSFTFLGSMLVALWSAGAGINSMIDGLNIAYGEPEKRNWFKRRALVIGFTAAAIVFVVLLGLLLVALPLAVRAAYGLAPADLWWTPFRWIAALALVTASFAAIYKYGPCRAQARQRWVWLGAVFASLLWLAGSLVYSTFVTRLTDFEAVYGQLGAAIGFMVWVWFSSMAILLGAELNAETEHQTAVDTTTGPEMPIGERGAAVADSVGLAFTGLNRKKAEKEIKESKIWDRLRRSPR